MCPLPNRHVKECHTYTILLSKVLSIPHLNREPKLLILYWQTVLLALLYYTAGSVEQLSEGNTLTLHSQISPGKEHKGWQLYLLVQLLASQSKLELFPLT